MVENQEPRPTFVTDPSGRQLRLQTLPPRTTRWITRRKAEVVAAVSGGLLSVEEACSRYDMDVAELQNWQRTIDCSEWLGLPPGTR